MNQNTSKSALFFLITFVFRPYPQSTNVCFLWSAVLTTLQAANMYQIFSHQKARAHFKKHKVPDQEKKGKQQHCRGRGDELNLVNLVFPSQRRMIARSRSQDSFSTITTAAETPDGNSKEVSIIWEGKLPAEVSVPKYAKPLGCGRFQKPRYIPEPSCLDEEDDDDDKDQRKDDDDSQLNNSFRRKSLNPIRVALHRSPSGGLDNYLCAPPRFTRFEI